MYLLTKVKPYFLQVLSIKTTPKPQPTQTQHKILWNPLNQNRGPSTSVDAEDMEERWNEGFAATAACCACGGGQVLRIDGSFVGLVEKGGEEHLGKGFLLVCGVQIVFFIFGKICY